MEDPRPFLQPLCTRFDTEALGPSILLTRRDMRLGLCFVRRELLDVFAEFHGELILLRTPAVEGFHEQEH